MSEILMFVFIVLMLTKWFKIIIFVLIFI
jgi:hypothetical protein